MEKNEVRNWVQETVENIFKGHVTEGVKNNVKLELDLDDESFWGSNIILKQWYNGQWMRCEQFFFQKYYSNYWTMVTDPWVCDMVTDITNEVMKFIQEPKKKSW